MSEQTKSLNQFLKENEAPVSSNSPTVTIPVVSGPTGSMVGDFLKKNMKPFLETIRRRNKPEGQ